MPRKTEWIERVPDILDSLAGFPAPVLDRASLEILFGVSRRQAVRIAGRFGGYQSGRTFLVPREALVKQLESLAESGDFQHEWRRRAKLHLKLEEDRRDLAARNIPVKRMAPAENLFSLPRQIRLEAGRLEISFGETTELLSLLHSLIQTIAANFEDFREIADRDSV